MIAEHLSVEEAAGLKEGFKLMDTSNRGKINIDELRVGLQKFGQQIPDSDLMILMEAVSTFFHLFRKIGRRGFYLMRYFHGLLSILFNCDRDSICSGLVELNVSIVLVL